MGKVKWHYDDLVPENEFFDDEELLESDRHIEDDDEQYLRDLEQEHEDESDLNSEDHFEIGSYNDDLDEDDFEDDYF